MFLFSSANKVSTIGAHSLHVMDTWWERLTCNGLLLFGHVRMNGVNKMECLIWIKRWTTPVFGVTRLPRILSNRTPLNRIILSYDDASGTNLTFLKSARIKDSPDTFLPRKERFFLKATNFSSSFFHWRNQYFSKPFCRNLVLNHSNWFQVRKQKFLVKYRNDHWSCNPCHDFLNVH